MAMAVDEPGSTVLPRTSRSGRRPGSAPRRRGRSHGSSALDDDDGIFNRGAAGAVNQRAALDDERLRLRGLGRDLGDECDTAKQRQQQS
jgi:hypothetical protein